jgi:hypothetical protein
MTDIYSIIEDANDSMRQLVGQMDYAPADELGLDRRAAYRLWVSEDCIIVTKNEDRSLQYYGGFEYVDAEYRMEMGDYVIYLRDDDRVLEHIEHFYAEESVEDEL